MVYYSFIQEQQSDPELIEHKSIKKRRIVKKKSHKKHKGGDVSALELADIQFKIQTIMS